MVLKILVLDHLALSVKTCGKAEYYGGDCVRVQNFSPNGSQKVYAGEGGCSSTGFFLQLCLTSSSFSLPVTPGAGNQHT